MAKKDTGFEELAEIWQKNQTAFFDAQKQAFEQFSESFKNAGGTGTEDLISSWNKFIQAWAPGWQPDPVSGGIKPEDFTRGQESFFALLDPMRWSDHVPEHLRTILQQVAAGPQFADLATPQADMATAWRESLDFQKAATDMSSVMQSAWKRAYEEYSKTHTLEDLQSGDVDAALKAWLNAANKELLDTQRSPEFIDAQKRMVRASTEIKARQRDLAEQWSEAYQMPTRTEVDDLTRIVHELRRELRKAKREIEALRAGK